MKPAIPIVFVYAAMLAMYAVAQNAARDKDAESVIRAARAKAPKAVTLATNGAVRFRVDAISKPGGETWEIFMESGEGSNAVRRVVSPEDDTGWLATHPDTNTSLRAVPK